MTTRRLVPFFTLLLILTFIVSCTPQRKQPRSLDAPVETAPRSTDIPQADATSVPQEVSPAPKKTGPAKQQQPRQQKTKQPQSNQQQPQGPQAFPTSSYVLASSEFNLILGRPTTNSIIASLYSRQNVQVSITYGTESGNYTSQNGPVDLKALVPQSIEFTGLSPDTAYFYKVVSNGTPSDERTFHTQRAPGQAFTFTIDSDPHNRDPRFNGELYATTLNNALADKPDFHINLGDTFMTEKFKVQSYTEAESSFSDMRPYFGIIGTGAPLFLVNGNHEGELGWLLKGGNEQELPLWSTQIRQLYYPNPIPNTFYLGSSITDPALGAIRVGYYAWTWGDALFITLDPYWYTTQKPQPESMDNNWNWSLGREQYDWLKTTLESSNAKYKFVFIHNLVGGAKEGRGGVEEVPFFEWGGNNANGSYGFDQQRAGWGLPIHKMLVDNHVSAVFHGHDHVFVKQELDGIIYQELPQPSNSEYNNTSLATEYGYNTGDIFGSSGHLRVSVAPTGVTVEYVRAYLPADEKAGQKNRQVDFTYTIQ